MTRLHSCTNCMCDHYVYENSLITSCKVKYEYNNPMPMQTATSSLWDRPQYCSVYVWTWLNSILTLWWLLNGQSLEYCTGAYVLAATPALSLSAQPQTLPGPSPDAWYAYQPTSKYMQHRWYHLLRNEQQRLNIQNEIQSRLSEARRSNRSRSWKNFILVRGYMTNTFHNYFRE